MKIRLFRSLSILMACVLVIAPAVAEPDETLPQPFSNALRKTAVSPDKVALVIAPAGGGMPIVAHRAQSAVNPASVMKTVTTYVALDLLGPAFTWNTTVWRTGSLENGVLHGDLIIEGSGDPSLTLPRFLELLRSLRDRGVREINGDLILDRQAIVAGQSEADNDPGLFDNDPLRPYNVIPDGLMVNFNTIAITLVPDLDRRRIDVFLQTPMEGLRVENSLTAVGGGCSNWRSGLKVTTGTEIRATKKPVDEALPPVPQDEGAAEPSSEPIVEEKQETVITVAGRYSFTCGENTLYLSPYKSERYVEGMFRALWHELGGSFNGRVRVGQLPQRAVRVGSVASPVLSEVIRDINKYSNNPMARLLYLSLSNNRPADGEGAERRLRAWLKAKSIDESLWFFENGSGLSRKERLTAGGLVTLLQDAWRSPYMPEFVASLPILGLDGTLRNRLINPMFIGQVRLKSGAIDGVRSLAGYIMDKSGRWWAVAVIVNDPKVGGGIMSDAFGTLIDWVQDIQ